MRSKIVIIGLGFTACVSEEANQTAAHPWDVVQDTSHRIAIVEGLSGPEAVRYDPDQDVHFVANFNGEAAGDSNGFISRVGPNGVIESLRFMEGTPAAPLHGPRGMFIMGDTLWAADADGIHGFDRRSGAHVVFVDFTAFEPGFLNDIAQGPDAALYITDTGRSRVYRLAGREATIAMDDSALNRPNGITWDAANERFLLASWDPGVSIHAWYPADDRIEPVGVDANGRHDGIELVGERLVIASQTDSSLHVLVGGEQRPFIRVAGAPADIGVDTRRGRVAVPYIALDRVDIWLLPASGPDR